MISQGYKALLLKCVKEAEEQNKLFYDEDKQNWHTPDEFKNLIELENIKLSDVVCFSRLVTPEELIKIEEDILNEAIYESRKRILKIIDAINKMKENKNSG